MEAAQDAHGDITWFDGVTDQYYGFGPGGYARDVTASPGAKTALEKQFANRQKNALQERSRCVLEGQSQSRREVLPIDKTNPEYFPAYRLVAAFAGVALVLLQTVQFGKVLLCPLDFSPDAVELKGGKVSPFYHDKLDSLLDRYARRLAQWTNDHNRNGASCPSVLVCGAANFPVRKKQKQNAREDSLPSALRAGFCYLGNLSRAVTSSSKERILSEEAMHKGKIQKLTFIERRH